MAADDLVWTSVTNCAVSGNKLTKNAGATGWNGGGTSTRGAAGNCNLKWTTDRTDTHKMCGLSVGNTDENWSDIDFNFYALAGGSWKIYEGTTLKYDEAVDGSGRSYTTSSVFKVRRVGTTITCSIDLTGGGTFVVFYTSGASSTGTLIVDSSIYRYTPNAGVIDNAVFHIATTQQGAGSIGGTGSLSGTATVTRAGAASIAAKGTVSGSAVPVEWENESGATATGSALEKTGGVHKAWDAGAESVQSIPAGVDGHYEYTLAAGFDDAFAYRAAGLSVGNTDKNYTDIDFAIYTGGSTDLYVFENGTSRYVNTSAALVEGEVFRVQRAGTTITFWRGSTLLFESDAVSTQELLVDCSLYGLTNPSLLSGSVLFDVSRGPAASLIAAGAGSIIGAGSLSGAATVTRQGAAAVAASGSLSGAATVSRPGAGSVEAAGSLAGVASVTRGGAAAIGATGSLSAIATASRAGAATIAAAGALSGAAAVTRQGAASIAASGSLSGTATVTRRGAAVIAGTGSLSGTAIRTVQGAATIAGVGTLTGAATVAAGSTTHQGSGVLTATGALSGTATRVAQGAAAISATGSLAAMWTMLEGVAATTVRADLQPTTHVPHTAAETTVRTDLRPATQVRHTPIETAVRTDQQPTTTARSPE